MGNEETVESLKQYELMIHYNLMHNRIEDISNLFYYLANVYLESPISRQYTSQTTTYNSVYETEQILRISFSINTDVNYVKEVYHSIINQLQEYKCKVLESSLKIVDAQVLHSFEIEKINRQAPKLTYTYRIEFDQLNGCNENLFSYIRTTAEAFNIVAFKSFIAGMHEASNDEIRLSFKQMIDDKTQKPYISFTMMGRGLYNSVRERILTQLLTGAVAPKAVNAVCQDVLKTMHIVK